MRFIINLQEASIILLILHKYLIIFHIITINIIAGKYIINIAA